MSDLPAGRELDALVAEKVMGWRRLPDTPEWGVPPDYTTGGALGWRPYSTDIAAAWEVVEKLREGWLEVNLDCTAFNCANTVRCCVTKQGQQHPPFPLYADAKTAPLAICRAALRAVGGPDGR